MINILILKSDYFQKSKKDLDLMAFMANLLTALSTNPKK